MRQMPSVFPLWGASCWALCCFRYYLTVHLASGTLGTVYEDWKEEKKEEQKAAKEKKKAKAGGDLSAEELLALQQQLFQQARERTLGITSGQGTAAPGGTTTAGPSEAAQ